MDNAPEHTPESLAQDAANAIDPALFEPAIRNAADDFYEQLLNAVQVYLKDNVQFNLSSHITTLEYTVKELRECNTELESAAADGLELAREFLEFAQSGASFNYPAGALQKLEQFIAKATGQ